MSRSSARAGSPAKSATSAATATLVSVVVVDDAGEGEETKALTCVRCQESTKFQDSQQYGRNPFSRACNSCTSAYRCRLNLIKKEKSASPDSKSKTEEVWNKYSKAEQTAWYLKQKRRDSESKFKHRDISKSVAAVSEEKVLKRGYQRVHRVVPFRQFLGEQTAKGFTDQQVQEQWRHLLIDPAVEREEHGIDNEKQVCLVMFGEIRKYVDEAELLRTGIRRDCEITGREDMAKKLKTMDEFHNERRREFGNTDAPEMEVKLPSLQLLDIEVPRHMMPQVPLTNQIGSGAPSSFVNELEQELRMTEETLQEAEEEWQLEAAKYKQQLAAKGAKRQMKMDEGLEKDLITARAACDRQVAAVESKWKDFEAEKTKFVAAANGLEGAVYKAMVAEVETKFTTAQTFKADICTKIREAKTSLSKQGIDRAGLKAAKLASNSASTDFVAELKAFKIVRHAMLVHQKTIDSELKKQAKRQKQTDDVTSNEVRWEPTWHLSEALSKSSFPDSVGEVFDFDDPKGVVATGESINGLVDRFVASSYYKNQCAFLAKHMEKTGTSTQRVSISVKAIQRDFDTVLGEEDVFPAAARATPEGYQKAGKQSWVSSFRLQLCMCRNHEFVGITSLGLGEAFVWLSGTLSVCGVRIGKFKGDLKEQVDFFMNQSAKDLDGKLDFAYRLTEGDDHPVLLVPPGVILCVCATKATYATWSFGAHTEAQVQVSRTIIAELFNCWPSLNRCGYKAWAAWLNSA